MLTYCAWEELIEAFIEPNPIHYFWLISASIITVLVDLIFSPLELLAVAIYFVGEILNKVRKRRLIEYYERYYEERKEDY